MNKYKFVHCCQFNPQLHRYSGPLSRRFLNVTSLLTNMFRYVGFTAPRSYTEPPYPTIVTALSCVGNESSITECEMEVNRDNPVGTMWLTGIYCFGR